MQPLLEVQRIDRKWLDTGQRFSGWRDLVPPPLHPQLALDQQQLIGNLWETYIHHEVTLAF
ncbi:hypothetical protein D9M71_800050 [compost metagenome]